MYILGRHWRDGYLDYAAGEGRTRIQVRAWFDLGRVQGVDIVKPFNVRMIAEYVRDVGALQVARKVRSRMAESLRNRRFQAIGLGHVAASDPPSRWPEGTPVVFVATAHPPCVERLVVADELVRPVPAELLESVTRRGGIRRGVAPRELRSDALTAWFPESGAAPDTAEVERLLGAAVEGAGRWISGDDALLPLTGPSAIEERRPAPKRRPHDGIDAVVFGLGNYAKTQILANLPREIRVACVHEIDPTQLGRGGRVKWATDSAPGMRPDEGYDAYFIAGFHHSHADLAVHALQRGAYAVVEKPQVTTRAQLERLEGALQAHPGRMFVCFHMRYNALFARARADLAVEPGAPVHYHAIVYEIPMPPHHWYTWPNAGSHMVSNGCHWLDNFLFLNDYARPVRHTLWRGSNDDTLVGVELENGAVAGLQLTHEGSPRIGVQQHIQLRAGDRSVTIENISRYLAEDRWSVLRRTSVDKLAMYGTMYRSIGETVVAGGSGDSTASILESARLMLDLEDLYQASGA